MEKWYCDPYGSHVFDHEKIFFHEEKLISSIKGFPEFPIAVGISPSDFCNQKCDYCVSKGYLNGEGKVLSEQRLINIINDISLMGSKSIIFTGGGEPLINKSTVNAIIEAKRHGLDVGLITNGINILEDEIIQLLENCTFIRISIDTMILDKYILLRGVKRNQFWRLIKNIKYLVEIREKINSKTLIGSQIVWYSQTREEIESSVKMLRKLKIDYVQIRPVDIAPSQEFKPSWSLYDDYEVFFNDLINKYSDGEFRVIPSFRKFYDILDHTTNHGRTYSGCPGGNFTSAIGADSKVYFCCSQIGNKNFVIGNLNESSLKDILLSEKRKEIIMNCDFSECQYVCRNHEINKIISKLEVLKKSDIVKQIKKVQKKEIPTHVNFL
jgi:MoaA/NifB/PqqE/SkfB family radical SAM enzyme